MVSPDVLLPGLNRRFAHQLREIGQQITPEHRTENFARLHVFRDWFETIILSTNDADTVLVLPCNVNYRYRTDVPQFVLRFPPNAACN